MSRVVSTGKRKVAVLALAVALLVVGTLVAYTYTGTSGKSETSLSSTGSSTSVTSNQLTFFNSSISPDGLQIEVALNTTSLREGRGLSAEVFLTNTLARNVSLATNFTVPDQALVAMGRGYACDGAGLLGILNSALYQGHYTATNFSQEAVPLLLEAPLSHGCPNPFYYVQPSSQNVEFAPSSDRATLSGQGTMSMHLGFWTVNATAGTSKFGPSTIVQNGSTTTSSGGTQLGFAYGPVYEGLRGYWTLPLNGNYIFVEPYNNSTVLQALKEAHDLYQEFPPGSYTVAAEDYWNQTVFAYFEVVASSPGSTSHCSTPIPSSNQSQTVDVYQIAPGSTGSICVDYEFESGGTYSVGPVDPGTLYVSSRGYSYQTCGATNINGTCPGLDITPFPAKFNHQAGEVVAVSFTVQTASNASGLYLLFVGSSDPVILAVGPVIPPSMPIFGQGLPGPPTPVNSTPPNVTIGGVSNIKVVVVPLSG